MACGVYHYIIIRYPVVCVLYCNVATKHVEFSILASDGFTETKISTLPKKCTVFVHLGFLSAVFLNNLRLAECEAC